MSEPNNKFIAGAIQMRSSTNFDDNIAVFKDLVDEAASMGAMYIQTPEMTNIIQKNPKALMAVVQNEKTDPLIECAASRAKKHGVFIHIGSAAVKNSDDNLVNRAFLFAPDGSLVCRYDKIHMFDVDLDNGESWRESALYSAGEKSILCELPFATLGMSICYDIRFSEIYLKQALNGANVLSAPAAFTRQTGMAHWHVLQRARAIENGAFLISAAQGGLHEDGRETYGHSLIVSPWGEVIAEANGDEPSVIIAEIDLAEVSAARAKIPRLRNIASFELERHAFEGGSKK